MSAPNEIRLRLRDLPVWEWVCQWAWKWVWVTDAPMHRRDRCTCKWVAAATWQLCQCHCDSAACASCIVCHVKHCHLSKVDDLGAQGGCSRLRVRVQALHIAIKFCLVPKFRTLAGGRAGGIALCRARCRSLN